MLKQVEDQAAPASKGLNTQLNFLAIQKDQSPNMMDVKVNYDGSIEQRLGTNTQNSVILANSAAAAFSPDNSGALTSNLLAFWKMDEPNGNRRDVFNNNILIDNINTGFAGGIKNQAANFVAANSNYLLMANTAGFTGNLVNFSISSWVYLNSTSGTLQQSIVSKKDNSYQADVVSLLHMDGADQSTTFTDSEITPKTWTANGNAKIVTAQSQFGGASALFDGTNSYISTPHHTDFDFGTGDFTIDCWVRFNNTGGGDKVIFSRGAGGAGSFQYILLNAGINLYVVLGATNVFAWSPNVNQWYHLAVVRISGTVTAYVNGASIGSGTDTTNVNTNEAVNIGASSIPGSYFDGWIDEFRIIKGRAAFTTNFTVPVAAYTNPSNPSLYSYWLYVDTNNQATFNVSSSGIVSNASVTATSFGALTTATWYNIVGWVDSANGLIGVSVNLATNSSNYSSGVLSSSAPFVVGAVSNGVASFMDGRIDEVGFWKKTLTTTDRSNLYNSGSANTYTAAFDNQPWASFDFGASSLRWLTVAAGTGLYASSNLGVSFVNIATDRTATYQYLDRSKNVLVATSDAYDVPLYWSGSAGTFAALLNNSAPLCKYSINFQGFLILLNSNTRKRGFFYNDENTQLTGAWTNNFDIPSSADDEITAAFVLRRYLYVSTRYKLFRISYVGGNPDWSFVEVKNWGFIPRTVRKITLSNNQPGVGFYYSIGEVAIGLTWDRKLRIFDGSGDQIISNPIEKDNGYCDFAIDKIAYLGSGPVVSFAETDYNQNIYKLCVAIGKNSQTTSHFINYDARALALYPESNRRFNCMCAAESANQRFVMAFDRSGYCHMLDSGNLDSNTTTINGIYDSPLMFNKSPSQSSKGHRTDLFFSETTAGSMIYSDRIDYNLPFTQRKIFTISGSALKLVHYESVDTPEMYNIYQFRISHQPSANDPWRLIRYDHFAAGLGIGKND